MSAVGKTASADPSTEFTLSEVEGLGMTAAAALGMTAAREALEHELVAWLNQRFAPDGPRIHAETLLFTSGLLDSLRILELIAWTERAIGREIADRAIRTDNFASAARIAALFATEGPDAHR